MNHHSKHINHGLIPASIAQLLEPRPLNPMVVGWSPGGGGHVPAMLRSS